MSSKLPDLSAPILPGESAAGIAIGIQIESFLSDTRPITSRQKSDYLVHDLGPVKIWSLNGRVTQIGLYEGYRGTIDEKIGIGSTIAEIEKWCQSKVVEDEEDNLVAVGRPGWCFETQGWVNPHSKENNRNAAVTAIFVHAL